VVIVENLILDTANVVGGFQEFQFLMLLMSLIVLSINRVLSRFSKIDMTIAIL